ncbi:DUF5710 domain-containing protein [Legionella gresilensis]|uniref:DUF5710 domain-containing protein n=1 Tax=Legionella gresilensis TaxID=91823 RepID=UPI001A948B08|nr:DUF5710 domain-containing protein [Legionella gresilensis]
MRIYLSVPYSEKEEAKQFGARWDPEKRLWYSPDGRKELTERWPFQQEESILELIGEDRYFGGNQLFVDLIPQSCWFTNVRKCVDPSDWDRLRKFVYARAGYQCECCQEKSLLDAHERWHFDEERKIQKLRRIIALCKPYHEATHMGLAQIKGREKQATEHLMRVTGMSALDAQKHIKDAFDLWAERNQFIWELDLTIITNSRIKLVQEFNDSLRKKISNNETYYIRDFENSSTINNNQIYMNKPEPIPPERVNITVSEFDKNSVNKTRKIVSFFQRIKKIIFS